MLETCAVCGQPISPTARFCRSCGRSTWSACPRCGGPVGAQARWCGTCGLEVVGLAGAPAGTDAPLPQQQGAPVLHGVPVMPGAVALRRRGRSPAAALLAVFAVAVVVIAGVVVLRPGAAPSVSTPPVAGQSTNPVGGTPTDGPAGSLPPIRQTKPATGHLTVGPETALATQTIGTGGGTIVAGGLQIQVIDGTLAADTMFVVKQASITASTFGGFVTPITPLYLIDAGDALFDQPVTVVLPATIPAGATAMAFSYDDASGMLTPLMPITQDATTLTVGATHFSPVFGGLVDLTDASAPVDSGFRPGTDDWQFGNYGSYLSPKGICEGLNLTAIWYYLHQHLAAAAPPLHGLYDNNEATPRTPGLWQDDSNAYRFAASIQASPTGDWPMYRYLWKFQGIGDGRANYEAVRAAIKATGQPQLMSIDTDARDAGHSLIVVEVEADRLLVSDPNYPGPANNPR